MAGKLGGLRWQFLQWRQVKKSFLGIIFLEGDGWLLSLFAYFVALGQLPDYCEKGDWEGKRGWLHNQFKPLWYWLCFPEKQKAI